MTIKGTIIIKIRENEESIIPINPKGSLFWNNVLNLPIESISYIGEEEEDK